MAKKTNTKATTKTADLRIRLDAETTRKLDAFRSVSLGRYSQTAAATDIIVKALADQKS